MSNMGLEGKTLTCPVEIALRGDDVPIGADGFIDEVLQAQWDEAVEELGDSLITDSGIIIMAQENNGIILSDTVADAILRDVNGCLKQRYLGRCAIASNCSGRTLVDKRLKNLGIQRYKDTEEI